nr:heavy metal translocating P-type ATPase [Alphaproteobacteria bacterium]
MAQAGTYPDAPAPNAAPPAAPPDGSVDYADYVSTPEPGRHELHLMVEGIHCGGCVNKIERALQALPAVERARVNLSTRRLALAWRGPVERAAALCRTVDDLGYRVVPFDPARLASAEAGQERELLRCMAIAGFAAGNVMLLSISVWAGHFQGMADATRDLLHWFSALIALPALAYAGQPFYRSAWRVLRQGHVNMDVPISLAVVLAAGMSLHEVIRSGPHAYFDSAITLLFFLLIGRYLDMRARGRARSAAERLLALRASAVTVLEPDGRQRLVPPKQVSTGMTVLVAAGERVGVDGEVIDGRSDVDTSVITGESVPRPADVGERVFAGTLNLSAPLKLTVTAVGEGTLLGEIVRLMEAAEQRKARYVRIADRISRAYAPAVHSLAAATFLGWVLLGAVDWQVALLHAVAVLIITCPCALGLAVPAVQVIASGRLMRQGILLKSATALERLTAVDTIVFDKTGTLTVGRPELIGDADVDAEAARLAAT